MSTGSENLFSISTHTLTWSVTARAFINPMFNGISTHTLTWSVTRITMITKEEFEISTHTLTWSVTVTPPLIFVFVTFQLTRSRGA